MDDCRSRKKCTSRFFIDKKYCILQESKLTLNKSENLVLDPTISLEWVRPV